MVVMREEQGGAKRLVAYVVGREGEEGEQGDAGMREELPEYMVPRSMCGWSRCR